MTDWAIYPGPEHYRPESVDDALDLLRRACSKEGADAAYNKVLFAVGNNHGGTLYPAAVPAVELVLEIAFTAEAWARSGAFEVLVELALFDAEPEFGEFDGPGGERVHLKSAVLNELRAAKARFLDLLKDATGDEIVRINVLDLLETLDDDVADVANVLRSMPERSEQGSFDGARRKFLIEHGYL